MIDVKTAVLEDNKEYFVIESVEVNGFTYKLFSNVDDAKNIKIRKIILKDGDKYLTGIDNNEEFDKVMFEFDKKLNS